MNFLTAFSSNYEVLIMKPHTLKISEYRQKPQQNLMPEAKTAVSALSLNFNSGKIHEDAYQIEGDVC